MLRRGGVSGCRRLCCLPAQGRWSAGFGRSVAVPAAEWSAGAAQGGRGRLDGCVWRQLRLGAEWRSLGSRRAVHGGGAAAPVPGGAQGAPSTEWPREGGPQQSYWQRFKDMYKKYWYVLIPVHALTSAAWMGLLYWTVRSGVDIVPLLEKLPLGESVLERLRSASSHSATYAYLASAYALYHVVSPLRYALTLGLTTLAIAYLRRWGYIRPVPSRDRLQQMIKKAPHHVSGLVKRRLAKRTGADQCDPPGGKKH